MNIFLKIPLIPPFPKWEKTKTNIPLFTKEGLGEILLS